MSTANLVTCIDCGTDEMDWTKAGYRASLCPACYADRQHDRRTALALWPCRMCGGKGGNPTRDGTLVTCEFCTGTGHAT